MPLPHSRSGGPISGPSLEDLYEHSYQKLLRALSARVRCPETARDIAQEAFSRLLSSLPGTAIRHPIGYVLRVAQQLAIDHHRAGDRALRQEIDDSVWESLPAHDAGPDDAAHSRRCLERLERAVSNLPPRRRRVFILCRLNGRSHDEVAKSLGISRSAVEKHLLHAMLALRVALREDAAGEPACGDPDFG